MLSPHISSEMTSGHVRLMFEIIPSLGESLAKIHSYSMDLTIPFYPPALQLCPALSPPE